MTTPTDGMVRIDGLIPQRAGPDGIRLVRTGAEDSTVLGDIAYAIKRSDLTFAELQAVVAEHAQRTGRC